VRATVDRQDKRDTWLRAELPVVNPVVSYRWLLDGGTHSYQWLNGAGLHSHDVADASDFRLSTYDPPPQWATVRHLGAAHFTIKYFSGFDFFCSQ